MLEDSGKYYLSLSCHSSDNSMEISKATYDSLMSDINKEPLGYIGGKPYYGT